MNLDHDRRDRKIVLYVEDHPVNVLLMQALIERLTELQLVVAHEGSEALCLAAGLNPALILLDMRLPDCRGSELLPRLRQLPGCERAPAVAVTADDDFDIHGTGFCELWPKPMDLRWVLQRMAALTASPTAEAATAPGSLTSHALHERERYLTAASGAALH